MIDSDRRALGNADSRSHLGILLLQLNVPSLHAAQPLLAGKLVGGVDGAANTAAGEAILSASTPVPVEDVNKTECFQPPRQRLAVGPLSKRLPRFRYKISAFQN